MMRPRKFRFLLGTLLLASGLLIVGGESRAASTSLSYTVTAKIGTASRETATYTYDFVQNPGSSTLSYIDFEIPVEIYVPTGTYSASGTANFVVSLGSTGLSGEVYDTGIGDFGTKFGVGDLRYKVLKANIPNAPSSFSIVLTIKGQNTPINTKLGVSQGQVLIKAGNGSVTQSFTIDTPAVVSDSTGEPTLSANPIRVSLGDCSKLEWTTTNASFVFISNIPGGVVTPNVSDCTSVCPLQDTTYTLVAIGLDGGTKTAPPVTVSVVADRLAPAPKTVQTICIGDVQQGGRDCSSTEGLITFKILRDPVYGIMTNMYVCGDSDYNTFAYNSGTCYPLSDPEFEGCCQFQDVSSGGEKVLNCTNMSGTGLAECLILGMGSPHYAQGANGVLNKNYPYCRSGEIAGRDGTGKIIECYKSAGVVHTD